MEQTRSSPQWLTLLPKGFVVADWDAQYAGVATALAGLDMAMPNGDKFWGPNLVEAVNNGSVPESRVDDMATRYVSLGPSGWHFSEIVLTPTAPES